MRQDQGWAGGIPTDFLEGWGWSQALRARRFGPQGQCGWAEGQDLGMGWDGAGKASLISEIIPHAQCPLTRPGQSAWQGGIRVFLKGEGIEMRQNVHNSSAF